MAKKTKVGDSRKIYMQKGAVTFELSGFDRDVNRANFSIDLGELDVNNNGISVKDFVKKLKNVVKKLEAHKGDVFVVQ